ncbi:uncharacterized protein LOC126264674 [Aethina tumida]|uniref:uncharacterized protein LOC126264674 n=1 Tax=Aethina tumida TaxID=116153 RepID=UPI00214852F2|nr:uncharacterized protein LOC126264674 [Aethina tumida]
MGCASSTPLVEGGKNLVEAAKETANDAVTKGEQALHDVGETAKDGIETVKETMTSAFTTAESSVGNVVGKIGETFNFTSSQVKEGVNHLEASKDEMINNASDATAEAISEAETVLASEADNVKEFVSDTKNSMNETMNSIGKDMNEKVEDLKHDAIDLHDKAVESLKIEEIDQTIDHLGDSVSKMEEKVEEVLKSDSPTKELAKEELPPTFWEAAADAIILKKSIKCMDFPEDPGRMFPLTEIETDDNDKKDLCVTDDLIISDLEK